MDFVERIKQLAQVVPESLSHVSTEEATKNALVMPFIRALGYDPFDPREVTPELTADVGVKKGEKVDYAILKEGKPIFLFECKAAQVKLSNDHASQLYRYFSVTEARFAILTNGVEYRFFTDLERPNTLDSKPFLTIDLLNLDEAVLPELEKFTKSAYDEDAILEAASALKYRNQIRQFIGDQFSQPTEDFVRFLASKVYEGRITQSVVEQFQELAREALRDFVNERINRRLRSAIASADLAEESEPEDEEIAEERATDVETTQEEIQAFYIVQAILSKSVDPARIAMRDGKTYCAVLLDDNNRKPICRFWFNSKQKYLGLLDETKKETRHSIHALREIHRFAPQLHEAVERWDPSVSGSAV